MGRVYRARVVGAAGFEKPVALKFMLPRRSGGDAALRMFQEEARLAASLAHANIAGILDFGVRGGNWYLAMEYVEGANLRTLLELSREKNKPMPPLLAAFIAAEIARGLHYAHTRPGDDGKPLGIVHRDVSPQNIVVSWQGEVKILDFGIALARNRENDDTGTVRGKFPYMSPEQALGEPMDFHSDIFSLGSVLYEMLTGEKAFPQPGMKAALAVSACDFERPDRIRRDLPVKLVSIVLRAMARDPFDRYLSAGEMLNELTQWIAEQRTRGAREVAKEDEHALLARWAAEVCEGSGKKDLAFSSDALSTDATKSGEEEWKPPPRSAVLGPGPRSARVDAPSGARVIASSAAEEGKRPLLLFYGVPAGAAVILVAIAFVAMQHGAGHPPASPTAAPVPSATIAAIAPATPAVAGSAGALALASPSPSPSATALRRIGLLQVTAVPTGAMVYLDGQEVSEAPALIPDLAVPHRYSVEVRKEGFADWGREVDMVDDNRVELVAKLVPHVDEIGHAVIEIADHVEVVLDGKSLGVGPRTVTFDGQPGGHQVHVHAADGKLLKEFTLELRGGETTMLTLPGS